MYSSQFLVHEIRGAIWPECPSRYRNMLQEANLELQFFVGCGKFSGSLRDPLIEFVGELLLFAKKPCFVKPDGRLIRRDAQKKSLGLSRELRPLRSCHDYADFTLQSQSQRHDRHVSRPQWSSVRAQAISVGHRLPIG